MSWTPLGWLLVASSIAISALIFLLRSDAARLALLSRLRSSSRVLGHDTRGTTGTLIVAAAVFLLVAGIGAVRSYVGDPPEATGPGDTDGEMLARLKDFTRSIGNKEPAPAAAGGELLPDVNTMTERLAARLKTTPDDIKGWRMLGWSYFHTGRYEQAAAAYAKAVELDPNSAELKLSHEEAKARASEIDNLGMASSLQTAAVGKGGEGPSVENNTKSESMPPREYDAAIRSMVDGLAHRLENSPRDIEGWTRLMRSRVVLGEREIAITALRKALEVFSDDSAATGRITAAAIELGLKAE
jgi:cytochrome c-type biogenesis protein CcmH